MSKLTKNQKIAYAKVEANKAYKLSEAAALLKEITFTKFDASVDFVLGRADRGQRERGAEHDSQTETGCCERFLCEEYLSLDHDESRLAD